MRFSEFIFESADITSSQLKQFEIVVDALFKKYGIDFNFTKHFSERLNDGRNNPKITIKELAEFVKKIYAKHGNPLKGKQGTEAVLNDLQSKLNIPIAIEYDAKNDEIDVAMKTIMRKSNFSSPDPIIKY